MSSSYFNWRVLVIFSLSSYSFFKKCINFWLHWVFVAAGGLSLVAEMGLLFMVTRGLLVAWLLLLRSTGSRHASFSSCGTAARSAGSRRALR